MINQWLQFSPLLWGWRNDVIYFEKLAEDELEELACWENTSVPELPNVPPRLDVGRRPLRGPATRSKRMGNKRGVRTTRLVDGTEDDMRRNALVGPSILEGEWEGEAAGGVENSS